MHPFHASLVVACIAAASYCDALATDILTNRGDLGRTGLNATETILNPTNVGSGAFGLLYQNQVDGWVYAQPLYVSQQRITPTGGQPRRTVLQGRVLTLDRTVTRRNTVVTCPKLRFVPDYETSDLPIIALTNH
jgi:hypothetical protein